MTQISPNNRNWRIEMPETGGEKVRVGMLSYADGIEKQADCAWRWILTLCRRAAYA
jgi:hypothetical protein